MPEILTESFCERCGTRYTFESAAPRAAKLKGIRVLSRGLKNFVMSDDASMDEAMAAARSETDREQTSQQLDAFHKTFNFCMTCRQYTCGNCWNEAEGRCLTCAPHLGHEILPAPFPDLVVRGPVGLEDGTDRALATNGSSAVDDALAWPTMDLEREDIEEIDASARLAAIGAYGDAPPVEVAVQEIEAVDATPEAEATVEPPADVDVQGEATASTDGEVPIETPAAAEAETGSEAPGVTIATDDVVMADESPAPQTPVAPSPAAMDPADVPGRAAAAAAQTTDLLRRFRPGQSLDAEIEAYEREQQVAAAEPAAAPEPELPIVAEAPEPILAEESEPIVAGATGMPEEPELIAQPGPVAAEAPPLPDAAAAAALAPREDVVPQPTWRIVAPDTQVATPSVPEGGQPASPDAISASAEPQWPAQPEWPSERPATGLAFLGRPALPTGGLESLWAESAREVTTTPTPLAIGQSPARGATGGVQPCVSCGLSLSATARFCRRCGTPQG